MAALQEARLEPMISASNATDAAIIEAFAGIPALLDQTPALILRGRLLDCDCLLGPASHAFHASIRQGRIVDLTPSPVLMRSWRFAYRASVTAWGGVLAACAASGLPRSAGLDQARGGDVGG